MRAFDLGITHFDLADSYGPPCELAEIDELIAGDADVDLWRAAGQGAL